MNRLPRCFAALSLLVVLSASAVGCSSTVTMTSAPNVPFAQGEIDAAFEDNGNGEITLQVKHLGAPAKLASGATVYVVWIQPKKDGAPLQNVGALQVDEDFEGEVTFSTTFRSFAISITAEPSADVPEPTGSPILRATVSG